MILLTGSDQQFHDRVVDLLGNSGDEILQAKGQADIERVLAQHGSQIVVGLLGPRLGGGEALELAQRLRTLAPDVCLVLVTDTFTPDLLTAAMRAGVRDVLPSAFTGQQLRDAIERGRAFAEQIRGRAGAPQVAPAPPQGKAFVVFSSKGGCGKSVVASNLAVLLAQRVQDEVVMVDLDLQFGDLAIMLQLFPARTISDAAQNLDRLDADALRGYLTPHRSRVAVLAAPLEPGLAETISSVDVRRILQMLKQTFRYIVIDCPPSFTDHVLASFDECEACVLMTSMDVPSIKNMKLSLQTLDLLGFARDRIRVVLNRADSKVGLRVQEVEKTLGTSVDVAIPSSRDVTLSINRGTPLAIEDPHSPVVTAIARILDSLLTQPVEGPRSILPQQAGRFRFGRKER